MHTLMWIMISVQVFIYYINFYNKTLIMGQAFEYHSNSRLYNFVTIVNNLTIVYERLVNYNF